MLFLGWSYGAALGEFVKTQRIHDLKVWTSWMKRTIQTASYIEAPQERWKALNEIDAVNYGYNNVSFITALKFNLLSIGWL